MSPKAHWFPIKEPEHSVLEVTNIRVLLTHRIHFGYPSCIGFRRRRLGDDRAKTRQDLLKDCGYQARYSHTSVTSNYNTSRVPRPAFDLVDVLPQGGQPVCVRRKVFGIHWHVETPTMIGVRGDVDNAFAKPNRVLVPFGTANHYARGRSQWCHVCNLYQVTCQ